MGNFLFDNGSFKQYHFDGGYLTPTGTLSSYRYYVKDHLGSNRILANNNGAVQQATHYYPYGGIHHFSTDQGTQKFKYNGKELDLMHGLNLYDYGARLYDPLIGQFTSMDPLCEKYYSVSPYAYCAGNPVNRVDPDGRDIWEFDKYGNLNRTQNNKMDKLIVHNKTNWTNATDYDEEGFAKFELVLPYGTINLENKFNQKENLLVLSVKGAKYGKSVFEFLSKACDVEWSQAKTDFLNSCINYVTTNHKTDNEGGLTYFLSDNPSIISRVYEANHSHPNNHKFPSGMPPAINSGDIGFAKWLNSFRTFKSSIWPKNFDTIKTNIYIPSLNKYYPY